MNMSDRWNSNKCPFYLLTLDEEPLKREFTKKYLLGEGIAPTILSGFVGETLGLRPTNPYSSGVNGDPEYIQTPNVGIALSHLFALKHAVLQGAHEFIIAEDDVVLVEDFVADWNAVRESFPPSMEIVQLEYCCADDKPAEQLSEFVWRCEYPLCSACNWWSKQGAIKAIRQFKIIDAPTDILMVRRIYPFLEHGIVRPQMVKQRTSTNEWYSTIHLRAGAGSQYP